MAKAPPVAVADGEDVTQGAKADVAWVSGDGTVISLLKKIASGGGGSAVTIADGADVAQGTTTDASSANTLVGLLKAIKAAVQGTLAVSGTFWQATQPVSLATNTPDVTDRAGRLVGHVTVDSAPTTAVTMASQTPDVTDRAGRLLGVVDTELPAAAALADATANPTVPSAGSMGMIWNGATWDRWNGRVQGDVADAAADAGNPVKIGGKFNATQPTYVDGNRGTLQLDSRGNVRIQVQSGVTVASVQTPADAQAAASGLVVSAKNMLWNGATDDRQRSSGIGDGNNTGIAMVNAGQYNGTNIDRQRGNWNGTTGDTGAKTTNFQGAAQTNYNARGAIITILIGAVSGTITTFQTGLEWSFDGGTTWRSLTALGANITTPASGNTIVWSLYPGNGAVTPAAGGGGTAPTQWNQAGIALPRTWRVVMSIVGTTPSITITSINVNYIV